MDWPIVGSVADDQRVTAYCEFVRDGTTWIHINPGRYVDIRYLDGTIPTPPVCNLPTDGVPPQLGPTAPTPTPTSTPSPAPTPTSPQDAGFTVDTSGAPLRVPKGPGLDWPVVGQVADGAHVTASCKFERGGTTWIHINPGRYVDIRYLDGTIPTPPVCNLPTDGVPPQLGPTAPTPTPTSTPSPAPTPNPENQLLVEEETYARLVDRNLDMCLTGNGVLDAVVTVETCEDVADLFTGDDEPQVWSVVRVLETNAGPQFIIKNSSSGLCLDPPGFENPFGSSVYQYPCQLENPDADNQLWTTVALGENEYLFRNVKARLNYAWALSYRAETPG